MIKELEEISRAVQASVEFAEKKNGALLAVNLVIIFGLLNLDFSAIGPTASATWWRMAAILLLTVSSISALISLTPKLNPSLMRSHSKPRKTDNLLFFGHAARYEPQEYLKCLSDRFGKSARDFCRIERDYAHHIVINSRIALRKHRLFRFAVWMTVISFLTPGLMFLAQASQNV